MTQTIWRPAIEWLRYIKWWLKIDYRDISKHSIASWRHLILSSQKMNEWMKKYAHLWRDLYLLIFCPVKLRCFFFIMMMIDKWLFKIFEHTYGIQQFYTGLLAESNPSQFVYNSIQANLFILGVKIESLCNAHAAIRDWCSRTNPRELLIRIADR